MLEKIIIMIEFTFYSKYANSGELAWSIVLHVSKYKFYKQKWWDQCPFEGEILQVLKNN